MKKIATILLLIFGLVQVAPAFHTICTDTVSVFMADEEKSDEKTDQTEKKDKKDYPFSSTQARTLSQQINTAFHLAEKIESHPCLEKPTPPPNFC